MSHTIYLREVLAETFGMEAAAFPINSLVDSNNLYQAAKSTKLAEDTRLRLDITQIQTCVKGSKVKIVWVKTDDMLADCLIKRGGKTDGLMDIITTWVLQSVQEANKGGVHLALNDKSQNPFGFDFKSGTK